MLHLSFDPDFHPWWTVMWTCKLKYTLPFLPGCFLLWCLVTAPETLGRGVKRSSCSYTGRQLFTCTQYKSVFAPLVFLCNYLQIIMIWSIIPWFSFCFNSSTHIFSRLMSYIWRYFYKKFWWKLPYGFQPWYFINVLAWTDFYINSAIGLQSAQRQHLGQFQISFDYWIFLFHFTLYFCLHAYY